MDQAGEASTKRNKTRMAAWVPICKAAKKEKCDDALAPMVETVAATLTW